jgi:hypothetical protein
MSRSIAALQGGGGGEIVRPVCTQPEQPQWGRDSRDVQLSDLSCSTLAYEALHFVPQVLIGLLRELGRKPTRARTGPFFQSPRHTGSRCAIARYPVCALVHDVPVQLLLLFHHREECNIFVGHSSFSTKGVTADRLGSRGGRGQTIALQFWHRHSRCACGYVVKSPVKDVIIHIRSRHVLSCCMNTAPATRG